MEAELVALTDNLSFVQLVHEFMCYLLGHAASTPFVYQDNQSVLLLVTRGGGMTCTKHLRTRMQIGKENGDKGWVSYQYLHISEMPADGASKVLEGKSFIKYVRAVMRISIISS